MAARLVAPKQCDGGKASNSAAGEVRNAVYLAQSGVEFGGGSLAA